MGLEQHKGSGVEQRRLLCQAAHRHARPCHDPARDRTLPRLHDTAEDGCQLRLVGIAHTYPHRNRARHTQPTLPQDNIIAARILIRRTQRRHHRTHDGRCAGGGEQHHGVARHALQEPHTHRVLLHGTHRNIMAAHTLHAALRAGVRLAHGAGGQKTQAQLRLCTDIVERHHEHRGGNTRRTAHHQGVLRRRKDEHEVRHHQLRLQVGSAARHHTPADGAPHE